MYMLSAPWNRQNISFGFVRHLTDLFANLFCSYSSLFDVISLQIQSLCRDNKQFPIWSILLLLRYYSFLEHFLFLLANAQIFIASYNPAH